METREQSEQAAASWIAQRDTGPWTEADADALRNWLAQSAGNRAAYYRLNAAWQEVGRLKALAAVKGELSPASAEAETLEGRAKSPPGFRAGAPAIAAGVIGVVVTALLFAFHGTLWGGRTYATVVGGLTAVPMADGSRVTLNTDSLLRIELDSQQRRVDLDHGEAFFEVARDPRRPFVVVAGGRRIVAVGTQFSVRREGEDVRVFVTEGTVRMEGPDGRDVPVVGTADSGRVLLPAGTIARVEGDDVSIQKKAVAEVEQRLSWRNGILTFRDTPLSDAVAEFNRYNTRQIVIDTPAIASLQVGGIFRATNLEPFVHLLEQGLPIRVIDQGDRIVLTAPP